MWGSCVNMIVLYLRDKLKPTTDAYGCDYIYMYLHYDHNNQKNKCAVNKNLNFWKAWSNGKEAWSVVV